MVVVSHLFLFLWKNFRGRFNSYESNLPLFGTIYFPTAPCLFISKYLEEKLILIRMRLYITDSIFLFPQSASHEFLVQ